MSGFFSRMRQTASNPSAPGLLSPSRKDANPGSLTPLEQHLLDAGPIRNDGSDKFWGLENFGNTCYANSILQCLYYSVPFREQVISYPQLTPPEKVIHSPTGTQRLHVNATSLSLNHPSLSYGKLMSRQSGVGTNGRQQTTSTLTYKPEDKEHSDYKKKVAHARGPTIAMTYDNAPVYGMPESLFTSLKDLFEALYVHRSRVGVVSPSRFLEILKRDNEMFRTAMHQDAHEFLNLLLNDFVESVEIHSKKLEGNLTARSSNTSESSNEVTQKPSHSSRWVHELFEGTLTSETKCLTCENISQKDEIFLDLSVDLEEHTSVTSCLRKFSAEEMLRERNKFHCDICGGLQEAERRMKIKRLPKILALHLKRFKYTEDLQRLQKLFHRVVYPYHLRLFNTTDDAEDPDRLYELYAVVVHIGGGPYHGHYVSIIKTESSGWFLFDDELVEPVDKSYVQNFFGDNPGLACAYVLFYQETTWQAFKKEQEDENSTGWARNDSPSSPDGGGKEQHIDNVSSEVAAINGNVHDVGKDEIGLKSFPLSPRPLEAHTSILVDAVRSRKERYKEDKARKMSGKMPAEDGEALREDAPRTSSKSDDLKASAASLTTPGKHHASSDKESSDHARNQAMKTNLPELVNGNASRAISNLPQAEAAGLSRFRNTSRSIRRTKLFGGSSKDTSRDDPALPDKTNTLSMKRIELSNVHESHLAEKSPEKTKHRFNALRKRASQMHM